MDSLVDEPGQPDVFRLGVKGVLDNPPSTDNAGADTDPCEAYPFKLVLNGGRVVATAIHNGHDLRPEVASLLALSESECRREEDPFTETFVSIVPTTVVGQRSRFEIDFNRPREKSVYIHPPDAWGLNVWRQPLPRDVVDRSLAEFDLFYDTMRFVLDHLVEMYGSVVVLDVHSYNHQRQGRGDFANPKDNPEINIGTGTMDRPRWSPVLDRFIDDLQTYDFLGRRLDVRENVKFQGGNLCRWIHATFPTSVCAIAIEFKKFFMDEWTGTADERQLRALTRALSSTVPGIHESLERLTKH